MTVRLVCGPPGAGKNTYIDSVRKENDIVIDFDVIRKEFPGVAAKAIRETLENDAKNMPVDVWVIRTVAEADKRKTIAERIGAEEVIVIAPEKEKNIAQLHKRAKEENIDEAETQRLIDVVDQWWQAYGVVESDRVITTFTAKEKPMPKPSDIPPKKNDEDPDEGKGFPANTTIEDMTTEEQVAYWRHHARKHENKARTLAESQSDYDEKKAFYEANKDKANIDVNCLTEQITKKIKLDAAPDLAFQAFKNRLGDRIGQDDLDPLLAGLSVNPYISDDGSIDYDSINAFADRLAPAKASPFPRSHQGSRSPVDKSANETGDELFNSFNNKGGNNA